MKELLEKKEETLKLISLAIFKADNNFEGERKLACYSACRIIDAILNRDYDKISKLIMEEIYPLCPQCWGSGLFSMETGETCLECHGLGSVTEYNYVRRNINSYCAAHMTRLFRYYPNKWTIRILWDSITNSVAFYRKKEALYYYEKYEEILKFFLN